jgi:enoyl-CoA hydratase/carnithine racemase
MTHIAIETRGALGVVTLNRPEKRNAFTLEMFKALTDGLTALDADPAIRAVVVHAAGPDFTTGLDLADVAPIFAQGLAPFSNLAVDPWEVVGRARTKPLIVAVQGRCYTLGLELALAADSCVAANDTVFAFREVRVGIIPLGGGVVRLLQTIGWSATMRYVLTGDDIGVDDALRMHLVQEIVPPGAQLARALAIAEQMAAQPPLAVQALLAHAREALELGRRAALAHIPARGRALLGTADTREAMTALFERRAGIFHGR